MFLILHRLKLFKSSLLNLFRSEHAQSVPMDKVRTHVNKENAGAEFDNTEMLAAIDKMMDDNQVMLADDVIFLI